MAEAQDDPDTSVLAAHLVTLALDDHNDPMLALLTLMQAAASLCLVRLTPASFAIDAFTGAAKVHGDQLRSVLRPDRVRQ